MKTEKAIEILHQDLGAHTYDAWTGLYEAQKLGLEALKRHKDNKERDYPQVYSLLPGETKD